MHIDTMQAIDTVIMICNISSKSKKMIANNEKPQRNVMPSFTTLSEQLIPEKKYMILKPTIIHANVLLVRIRNNLLTRLGRNQIIKEKTHKQRLKF